MHHSKGGHAEKLVWAKVLAKKTKILMKGGYIFYTFLKLENWVVHKPVCSDPHIRHKKQIPSKVDHSMMISLVEMFQLLLELILQRWWYRLLLNGEKWSKQYFHKSSSISNFDYQLLSVNKIFIYLPCSNISIISVCLDLAFAKYNRRPCLCTDVCTNEEKKR